MPSSIPKRSVATSMARTRAFVHTPRALSEHRNPLAVGQHDGSHFNSIASGKREKPFLHKLPHPRRRLPYRMWAGKSPVVANALRGTGESRFSLVRDCAQPFDQRLAFCAIVDHERVVFAMRRPRTTRHFLEIHEPPISDVGWF
jgi:hypothetical protein